MVLASETLHVLMMKLKRPDYPILGKVYLKLKNKEGSLHYVSFSHFLITEKLSAPESARPFGGHTYGKQ